MGDRPPSGPELLRVKDCDLCRALKLTPWFWEDEICWIAECEICETPMVVWRYHGTAPPAEHVAHMRERLTEIATAQLGELGRRSHAQHPRPLPCARPPQGRLLRLRPQALKFRRYS